MEYMYDKIMKLKVKTLKGTHFIMNVKLGDTVADLKKNIEDYWGPIVYPASRQMLIHRGKVMEDDTFLYENDLIEPDDFIVIMLVPRNRVAPPPPPPPSSTTHNQEASRDLPPVTEAPPPPPAVNQERAESQSRDLPPVTEAPPPPPEATQPPPVPPTGPNTNPLNLFPRDRPGSAGVNLDHILSQLYIRGKIKKKQPAPAASDESLPTITPEDEDALDRLSAMGFSRLLVWQAYLACDKNEEQAANFLLDQMPDSEN